MTTIAYRDGVLAADTGVATEGGSRVGSMVKIVRGPTGNLGGASGTAGYSEAFKRWVLGGEQEPPPEPKSEERYFDKGAVFHADGKIDIHEPGGRFIVAAPYYAFGSGSPEALGAMFAGADAETAVRAAIAHDTGTHGSVTVLRHEKQQWPALAASVS
jgi:hypothetical protein